MPTLLAHSHEVSIRSGRAENKETVIISILEEDVDDDDDKTESQSCVLDISESTIVNVSQDMNKTEEDPNEKGQSGALDNSKASTGSASSDDRDEESNAADINVEHPTNGLDCHILRIDVEVEGSWANNDDRPMFRCKTNEAGHQQLLH